MSEIIRTCTACRKKKQKQEMLRIVRTRGGEILLDPNRTADGRGAYLCPDRDCIEKCIKTRSLNRSFRLDAGKQIYDILKERLT